MRVGIIGGTGPAGRAIAARLVANGTDVLLGSRIVERGEQCAIELRAKWPGRLNGLIGGGNEEAARADLVILATPFEGAVPTAQGLMSALEGRVLVSMVNALARVGREFQALIPARGSIAANVQAVLPKTLVTAAFHHVPAGDLGEIDKAVRCDVLICADDPGAGKKTAVLVESMPGLRAVLAGSLASASAVEALTAVLLNVNIAYKTHVALGLYGLFEDEDNTKS
jgi:NADPH-dependent F420 reductase